MANNNEKAVAAFTFHLGKVEALLDQLNEACDDHLGVNPETLDWGHVGLAQRLQYLLEGAVTFAQGKEP
jgi:hypothetical protein